jgi:hypothetical protein
MVRYKDGVRHEKRGDKDDEREKINIEEGAITAPS